MIQNGFFESSDKCCNICKLYLNQSNLFLYLNHIRWEIHSRIAYRRLNVLYYLKSNICNKTTTYIGKTVEDIDFGFKSRMN